MSHAPGGAQEQAIGGAGGEQAVAHDPGNAVDLRFHRQRPRDGEVVNVENAVAVVGGDPLAQNGVAPELYQFAGHVTAGHGNHFDRQGEGAEGGYPFALIGDTDEFLRHRRDDLLPGQRSAAAFDELQRLVALVRAVDVELEAVHGIEVIHRDALPAQTLGAGRGAGHGAVEAVGQLRQAVDKEVRRGTGANTQHRIRLEAGFHELQRGLCHAAFQTVLAHTLSREHRKSAV